MAWERKDSRRVHLQENSQFWGDRWVRGGSARDFPTHLRQHSCYSSPKQMNNGLTGREEGALRGHDAGESHLRGRPPQVIADD